MKKTLKNISTFLLALTLSLGLSLTAFAADSSITFEGKDAGFTFKPGSEYTATDLFDNFKNVMPGDTLKETIAIQNHATDCDYIKLYIRAVAHEETANPLSTKVAAGETVASMTDFLAQLSMKVYNGDVLIYEASPDELDGLAENVHLGAYRSGAAGALTVELKVPNDLENKYANRKGEVDWIFTVEAYDDPESDDDTDDSEPVPQPVKPTLPKTGDNSPVLLYVLLICFCGIVLGILLFVRKKKGRKEEI